MSAKQRQRDEGKLIIGGEPRADLLPPEVEQAIKGRSLRRSLIALIVLALAIVGGGYVYSSVQAASAERALSVANERTLALLAQQSAYAEAREMRTLVDLIEKAREVGTSTEIDWKTYLDRVAQTLPPDTRITHLTTDSGDPTTMFAPPASPLEGPRVARVELTAVTPTLPDIPAWLNALAGLPGYADAWPKSVSTDEFGYTVNITMHINSDALLQRFAQEGE